MGRLNPQHTITHCTVPLWQTPASMSTAQYQYTQQHPQTPAETIASVSFTIKSYMQQPPKAFDTLLERRLALHVLDLLVSQHSEIERHDHSHLHTPLFRSDLSFTALWLPAPGRTAAARTRKASFGTMCTERGMHPSHAPIGLTSRDLAQSKARHGS